MKKILYSYSTLRNWFIRLKHYGLRNVLILRSSLRKNGRFALRHSGREFYLRGNTVDFAVFNSIFAKGEYDFNIDFEPEYIIDAGANIGASTLYFHNRFRNSKIIAVEPEQTNYELLEQNMKTCDGVICLKGGIYGEDTFLAISDSAAEKYAFRVEKANDQDDAVRGYSIGTLMGIYNLPRIDILKMDIEGAEYSVFKEGRKGWLLKVRVLIIEMHDFLIPGVSELVIKVLKESGFIMEWKGENMIAVNGNFGKVIDKARKLGQ